QRGVACGLEYDTGARRDAVAAELSGLHALVVEVLGAEPVLASAYVHHPMIGKLQSVIDIEALPILIRGVVNEGPTHLRRPLHWLCENHWIGQIGVSQAGAGRTGRARGV